MSKRSLAGFLGGIVIATMLWLVFSPESETEAPAIHGAASKKPDEAPKTVTIQATAQAPEEATERPPSTAESGLTWAETVNSVTSEDRRARRDRVRKRVALARIQRYLVGAPVRSENLSRLLDLLPYRLDFNYHFETRDRSYVLRR